MIRRGCLLGLLGVVVGLGLIGEGVDVGARHFATSRIVQRIRSSAPEAHGVRARILGWPFLQVVVNGHVSEIGAHADTVVERGLTFRNVDVVLHGIKIDQGKLISQGKVTVKSISSGLVTASIAAGDLSSALGLPISAGSGGFLLRGTPVRVTIDGAARVVDVSAAGLAPVSLPLPGPNLLPCVPTVSYSGDTALLSCAFTRVPSAFT
jgi:hypothetical protein